MNIRDALLYLSSSCIGRYSQPAIGYATLKPAYAMTTQDKRSPALSDTDTMPFGKHKGEPMQDVPARYLAWLYRQAEPPLCEHTGNGELSPAWLNDKRKLANYIHNSKAAIELETGETL